MDGSIPRRRFLQSAGVATTAAAVALGPRTGAAAEQLADDTPSAAPAAPAKDAPFDPAKFVVQHQLVKAGREKN